MFKRFATVLVTLALVGTAGANGDLRIDDVLKAVPQGFASPIKLVRNTGGIWFAAGVAKFGDD